MGVERGLHLSASQTEPTASYQERVRVNSKVNPKLQSPENSQFKTAVSGAENSRQSPKSSQAVGKSRNRPIASKKKLIGSCRSVSLRNAAHQGAVRGGDGERTGGRVDGRSGLEAVLASAAWLSDTIQAKAASLRQAHG